MDYKHLIALALFFTILVGCKNGNDSAEKTETNGTSGEQSPSGTSGEQSPSGTSGGLSPPANRTQIADDTVAYISSSRDRKSIRVIQSDGGNDRLLWTAPENPLISPVIGSLAWRPDGTELAFDSDHAFGMSLYGRDLYAVTADGSNLRKITNPPEIRYFEAFPKGGAKLYSRNWLGEGTNFWSYIEGSSTNVTWLAASIENWTITFNKVADYGAGVRQQAVVGYFGYNGRRMCRYDLAGAADIVPGETIEIAQDFNAWSTKFQHCLTVRQPSWNYSGEGVLYTVISGIDEYSDGPSTNGFENYSMVMSNAEKLSLGDRGVKLGSFTASYVDDPKHIKLSPTQNQEILMVISNHYADRIYLTSTSDKDITVPDRLQRIDLGFCHYGDNPAYSVDKCRISDIEWLPDGNGFLVSMYVGTGNKFDQEKRHFYRIYRHNLQTESTDMLLSLENEYIGNISVSPDAERIAFERGDRTDGPYDIWIYDIATEGLKLLVEDAAAPAWSH